MPKNAQTTAQLHSSHTLSKVMLKSLHAKLQQSVNHELPDAQAGLRKGRGIRDQIAIIIKLLDHRKSKSSRKTSSSALLTVPKPLTV